MPLSPTGCWAIEPMFSDFKSRGFGVEDTQIQHPDRVARLLLVMALALYIAVSTRQWHAETNPPPAEKRGEAPTQKSGSFKNVVFHPRPTLYRLPHPQPPAAPDPLVRQN
jgi:hypothetical protein